MMCGAQFDGDRRGGKRTLGGGTGPRKDFFLKSWPSQGGDHFSGTLQKISITFLLQKAECACELYLNQFKMT